MDYPYVQMLISLANADVPQEYHEAAEQFRRRYNEYERCNSTCGHLGEGWFILYDYPLAEKWARECSWNPVVHLCEDTSYTLIHFPDSAGAVEMKLRWFNA